MTKIYKILFLITFVIFTSCSSDNKKVSIIEESDLELQMIDAYKEGYKELEKGDVIYAAKKFNEAELLYPQSEWASKSILLSAYAYYSQNYYDRSIIELLYSSGLRVSELSNLKIEDLKNNKSIRVLNVGSIINRRNPS